MSPEYIPSTSDWVREQVEKYEGSGGKEGTTLRDTGRPVIIVKICRRILGRCRRLNRFGSNSIFRCNAPLAGACAPLRTLRVSVDIP